MLLSLVTPVASVLSSTTANAQVSALASLGGDKRIQEVQTGYDSTCAVVNSWAYCWGSNYLGKLGDGTTTDSKTPVAVSSTKTAIPEKTECTFKIAGICLTSKTTPAVPASAMAGLEVEKVTVGVSHACAIASAKVYCWGDNTYGQLGNRSTKGSYKPVKVDVSTKDETGKPKSALAQKEIIDVTAGEFFTCALASDGTTACWGTGSQGRLGTGSENDVNYPEAIDTAPGSPLVGKKAIKLARASLATVCVLAVSDAAFTNGSDKGNPYCWGVGIGTDTIPAPGRVTVPCSKTSPTSVPTGAGSITTYFTSSTPVQISSTQLFTQIDGVDYLTGLADNSRAYYWGMHGYREDNKYVSHTSCSINPCTADAGNKIRLAATAKQQSDKAKNNAKNNNKPGGDKNKNLSSNTTAQQSAQNAANGGNYTSVSGNYNSVSALGNYAGAYNFQTGGTTYNATVQQNGSGGISYNVNHYAGVARPSGSTVQGANVGNNNNKPTSCAKVTHYGYTADRTVTEVGKTAPTIPKTTTLNQVNLATLSGNIENGLFCATKSSGGTFCDANGGLIEQGQTGSNYTKSCTGGGWTPVKCATPPTGPQQVVATGWLNGKTVTQLSTGLSGYTCALANNSIGCWGQNYAGQLGTGDTVNKLVPTVIKM